MTAATESAPTHIVDRTKPGVSPLLRELKGILDRVEGRAPGLRDAERAYDRLRSAQRDDEQSLSILRDTIVKLSSGSDSASVGAHRSLVDAEARKEK